MSDTSSAQGSDLGLYTGVPQHENFQRMMDLFPSRKMEAAENPVEWPDGPVIKLPESFTFEGVSRSVAAFMNETDTSALLVLHKGEVRFEDYYLTGGRDVAWISWSMAKSFISALVGIAVNEGLIQSVDDPISNYVPRLTGSAYDGVPIRHVLAMSSGARWSEDYSDPDADVHKLSAVMAGASTLDDFVADMQHERAPGSLCQYNSADTQALGMLLACATGRDIAQYMQQKLCVPLGMTRSSYWLLDIAGRELALGGLCMTARDFAKIGELFRNNGRFGDHQILPAEWVTSSITPTGEHQQAGNVIVGGHVLPLGYGDQWWVPAGDRGEFSAIGVYNQFVFVDPSRDAVIVKLSANRAYGTSPEEAANREMETVEFLRAVAAQLD
ncbi:serine hydrolase domain-containing protein [Pyruvatibacter sp.]